MIRGSYKLKGNGPFVNINCRKISVVKLNRGGYIPIPFVILCKYEKWKIVAVSESLHILKGYFRVNASLFYKCFGFLTLP